MTIEGVTGAVISGAEETVNRGGVSTDISMLATEKAGSVVVAEGAGSTINVIKLGLVITFRLVVTGAEDTAGMETSSLVSSGWDSICSITIMVEGTYSVSSIAIEINRSKREFNP